MANSTQLYKDLLHYRVTTPLYLGGADPAAGTDTRIYVRPIVAQWRWWFRALAGGVFGTTADGLEQVRAAEQRLFGGVHKVGPAGIGPMQFRVRLAGQKLLTPLQDYTGNRDPVMNYLGFGLGRTRDREARLGIPPGSEFTLEVIASEDVLNLLRVLNYFWANFGGLGARHRRGLGSIEWLQSDQNPAPQDGRLAKSKLEQFRGLLNLQEPKEPSFAGHPEMPVVHPAWFLVKVTEASFDSWEDALAAIRNQLRIEARGSLPPRHHLGENGFGYRQGDGRTHNWQPQFKRLPNGNHFPYYPTRDKQSAWALFNALSNRKRVTVSLVNPLFGLPVVYGGWRLSITVYEGQEEIRRPSPVSFRVFRNNRQYKVAIVYFKSRFLPERSALQAVWNGRQSCPVSLGAGWEYLDRFFALCEGQEVKLR